MGVMDNTPVIAPNGFVVWAPTLTPDLSRPDCPRHISADPDESCCCPEALVVDEPETPITLVFAPVNEDDQGYGTPVTVVYTLATLPPAFYTLLDFPNDCVRVTVDSAWPE